MTEVSTTNIDQLPINPQITSNNNQIQLIKNELPNQLSNNPLSNNQLSNSENLDTKIQNYGEQLNMERKVDSVNQNIDYNTQLSSVLKEASEAGVTVLPSRDIPQNVLKMQHDEQVKPNFIPEKNEDYIGNIVDRDKEIQEKRRKQNQTDNLDYIFEQIQQPLLISIIYFIFQLPILRNNMFIFLPKLFHKDGNPNIYGYLINSLLFGLIYFSLSKGIGFLGKIQLPF